MTQGRRSFLAAILGALGLGWLSRWYRPNLGRQNVLIHPTNTEPGLRYNGREWVPSHGEFRTLVVLQEESSDLASIRLQGLGEDGRWHDLPGVLPIVQG